MIQKPERYSPPETSYLMSHASLEPQQPSQRNLHLECSLRTYCQRLTITNHNLNLTMKRHLPEVPSDHSLEIHQDLDEVNSPVQSPSQPQDMQPVIAPILNHPTPLIAQGNHPLRKQHVLNYGIFEGRTQ